MRNTKQKYEKCKNTEKRHNGKLSVRMRTMLYGEHYIKRKNQSVG